jgi:hypothetical protein
LYLFYAYFYFDDHPITPSSPHLIPHLPFLIPNPAPLVLIPHPDEETRRGEERRGEERRGEERRGEEREATLFFLKSDC